MKYSSKRMQPLFLVAVHTNDQNQRKEKESAREFVRGTDSARFQQKTDNLRMHAG
jgi:hypothetical protein